MALYLFSFPRSPIERSESCEIFNAVGAFENLRKNRLCRTGVSFTHQDEKIRMAQAAGLYLFSFPRYRQLNVRSRVKFLMMGGPLKTCPIVPYGREKIQFYAFENLSKKPIVPGPMGVRKFGISQ